MIECFGYRAHTNDRRGLEPLNGFDKIPYGCVLIERIASQRFIVGAAVQQKGQGVLRGHPGTRRVQCQLADRDSHARTEIAKSKNSLAGGDHDEPHVAFRPVSENASNAAFALDRNIQTLRTADNVAKLQASASPTVGV